MQNSKFSNATKLSHKHIIRHHIHKAKSSEYLRVLLLRTVGNFLVISSLFMIGKTFYNPAKEEMRYLVERLAKKQYIVADTKDAKFQIQKNSQVKKGFINDTLKIKPVEVLVPEDPEFSLVVPKIGANAKIIPNVDASNENIYLDVLNKGIAHTWGTAFPGEGGHIFLFAHSTDYFWNVGTYNAIFYLLYKLEQNDEINIFYKRKKYVYKVIGKEVVDPSQVQYLTRKTNKEFLTLQTCWPPGTTLQRLMVFAVRKAE